MNPYCNAYLNYEYSPSQCRLPRGCSRAIASFQKPRNPTFSFLALTTNGRGFRSYITTTFSVARTTTKANKMHATQLLAGVILFAATALATPYPWAAPQASLVPHPKHNATHPKGNRTHKPHREPTPTFKQKCNCPKPIIPLNLLSENEVSAVLLPCHQYEDQCHSTCGSVHDNLLQRVEIDHCDF